PSRRKFAIASRSREHARSRHSAAMEPDHQFAGRERTFHFALSKSRWPGCGRFRLSATPEPKLSLRLSRRRPRKCAHRARTNLKRDVGAHQSYLPFHQGRDREKDAAFESLRILSPHHYRLTSR